MTGELTFVDTNVLLYAHDRSAADKHVAARALVARLWDTREGVLSTQVLEELYVNATRKLPHRMPEGRARRVIAQYATWRVQRIDPEDVIRAAELEKRHRLSFWDALIVTSAARAGAAVLATEDLQHGRNLLGLRIVNPFSTD